MRRALKDRLVGHRPLTFTMLVSPGRLFNAVMFLCKGRVYLLLEEKQDAQTIYLLPCKATQVLREDEHYSTGRLSS